MRFLQWNVHQSAGETAEWIEGMREIHDAGEKFTWLAVNRVDGVPVGLGSIKPDEESGTAWIGILVFAGLQGRGFGQTLAGELASRVLQDFGKVSAGVETDNEASVQLLRKLGWRERPMDEHGEFTLFEFSSDEPGRD